MKKKNDNIFDVIIYSMMIVAVIYAVVQTLLGHNNLLSYKITLGVWILASVIISDFVDPLVNKKFDKMKSYKIQSYIMYAIADAAMYASIYVFIINVSYFKEPVHYVFLAIAFILLIVKSRLYSNYRHATDSRAERLEKILREEQLEDLKTMKR